ncbi:MAG: ATP-binding protein [Gemmataceae bacterium]|nr:ATP-binding protein [Gemmataceae bacterium]
MASESLSIALSFPSDLCHLAAARAFIAAVCKVGGFDQASTDALALAVHEALHNVIEHAHKNRAEVPLEIRCYPAPGFVEIQILDEGAPFDLAAVPQLDPAELRVGGRGVFLMRALTDELSCRPRGQRGNVLRLVKRNAPTTPDCSRP